MNHKTEYQLKITELARKLESGWSTSQILKEYMPKWGLSSRSIERYLAFARDLVASRMKKREAVIESVRADIIAHEAETWLKSNLELEARLCAIVSGKVEFDKIVRDGKEITTVKCRPSCAEVINAIDLLLKMRKVYKDIDTNQPRVIEIVVDNEEERLAVERIREQGRLDSGN